MAVVKGIWGVLGCAPLAPEKITRISARISDCTAPAAQSIDCNGLDSDTETIVVVSLHVQRMAQAFAK